MAHMHGDAGRWNTRSRWADLERPRLGRLVDRAGGDGLAGGPVGWLVGSALVSRTCSRVRVLGLARRGSGGRAGPEGRLKASRGYLTDGPALLGWGR